MQLLHTKYCLPSYAARLTTVIVGFEVRTRPPSKKKIKPWRLRRLENSKMHSSQSHAKVGPFSTDRQPGRGPR